MADVAVPQFRAFMLKQFNLVTTLSYFDAEALSYAVLWRNSLNDFILAFRELRQVLSDLHANWLVGIRVEIGRLL